MGTCESQPSNADQDLHVHPAYRQRSVDRPDTQNQPLSPRFITSYSPATAGVNYPRFETQNNQSGFQDNGMLRENPIPGQRQAITFGRPDTSANYQEPFSASTQKESFSPPKNFGSEQLKISEKNYEIRYPFAIDRTAQEQALQAPVVEERGYQPKEVSPQKYSIPKEIFSSSRDPDAIIYEGYLLKYKPGTGFNWVERWCSISRKEFKYFKDQYSAKCWDSKPLVSVKISDVITALRVNMNLPSFDIKKEMLNSFKNRDLRVLYYFEIFDQRNELLESEEAFGNRNTELYDNQNGPFPIQRDHLMRPPLTQKTTRKTRDQASPNLSHRGSQAMDSARGQIGSGLSPNRLENLDRNSAREGQNSRWIKDKNDLASWTGRENEWYYSEKRLLFATPDHEEREKWVAFLEWVINEDDTTAR